MFVLRRIRKTIRRLLLVVAAISTAFTVGNGFTEQETTSVTMGLILSTTQGETAAAEATSTTKVQSQETHIMLADELTFIKGEGASFSDGVVTVEKGGTYLFRGELNEGRIVVDLKEKDKEVVLKFYGVRVNSSTGAPVSVLKSDARTVLEFVKGTVNNFADTDERVLSYNEDEGDSAVVFSKGDIVLTGEGAVSINAMFNKGIFAEKNITLKNTNLNIVSFDDGIRSKDSLLVEDSRLEIVSGGDGIHIDDNNRDEEGKVLVYNSVFSINSELDGIESAGDVLFYGGKVNITTAGGSTGRYYQKKHSSGFSEPDKNKTDILATGRATADSSTLERLMGKSPSFAGINAEGSAVLSDVIIRISSVHHGLDCKSIEIENGRCSVKSDSDGFYAAEDISVNSSDVNIFACDNGMDCKKARFVDGKIFISAYGESVACRTGNDGVITEGAEVQIERKGKVNPILPTP